MINKQNYFRFRKCIAMLLMLMMFVNYIPLQVHAKEYDSLPTNKQVTIDDILDIQVNVDNTWDNHYNLRIIMTNISANTLHNWCIATKTTDDVQNLYNAIEISDELEIENEEIKVFKNSGYNQDIDPGESVAFGYTACYTNNFNVPEFFEIVSKEIIHPIGSCSCNKNVISYWQQGAIEELIIKNNTDKRIEDWTIEFDSDMSISEVWNGELIKSGENHYIITNPGYNQNIEGYGTISIGMLVSGNCLSDIRNVLFSSVGQKESEYIFMDQEKDTDGDGLPDFYENEIGTNIQLADTDNDGLSDYIEVYETLTDPLKYDSVIEGVSDSDVDIDGDTYSNKYELEIGLDPYFADSDFDGITDNDELEKYKTYPLKRDTDGDGITDGDEILLGLNPLKIDSDDDGIVDSEEVIPQIIDENNFDDEIFNENIAIPSIVANAKGNINKSIKIEFVPNYLIGDERAIIGNGIDIQGIGDNGGTLTYSLPSDYEFENYKLGTKQTEGLLVEYYNGENVIPLETIVDNENKTVSANIAGDGWYYILYLPGYLSIFGYEMPTDDNMVINDEGIYVDIDSVMFEQVEEFEDETAEKQTDTEIFESEDVSKDEIEEDTIDAEGFVENITDLNTETEEDLFEMCDELSETEGDATEEIIDSDVEEVTITEEIHEMEILLAPGDNSETEKQEVLPSNEQNPNDNTGYEPGESQGATVGYDVLGAGKSLNASVEIVFVFDTTGSMSSVINNTQQNLGEFADELKREGISASYGVVDYKDITKDNDNYESRIIKNNYTNWFTSTVGIKNALNELKIYGGGDYEECAIDGLATAREMKFKENAQKFFILVTDAASKVDNNYGIESMGEMANLLLEDGVTVAVIAPEEDDCHGSYDVLWQETDGTYVNIYSSNYLEALMKVADKIKENADGYWIALDTPVPKIVKLDAEPAEGSKNDTDRDGVYDIDELSSVKPYKLVGFNDQLERLYGGDARFDYKQVGVYAYKSNPAKADSDSDGMDDKWDSEPLDRKIGMIIYERTYEYTDEYLKGLSDWDRKNGKGSEDWQYQDKTPDDLKNMKYISASDVNKSEAELEASMKTIVKIGTASNLQSVGEDMVSHFVNGTGNDYENEELNDAVRNHEQTCAYISGVEEILEDYFEVYADDFTHLKYDPDYREESYLIYGIKDVNNQIISAGMVDREETKKQPSYNSKKDITNGIAICVHGLFGNRIELVSYNPENNEYEIRVTLYDVYGLDSNDIETNKIKNVCPTGWIAGFKAWYILQHNSSYTNYKPYITYMSYDETKTY